MLVYSIFNIIYIILLGKTKNFQIGLVLLLIIQIFSIFSNMYTLPAVGISLFYVYIPKLRFRVK